MQVTVIPIVLSILGMVPKGLEKRLEQLEIGRRIKTIMTTTLLRLKEYSGLSWKPEVIYSDSDSSERPPPNATMKKEVK